MRAVVTLVETYGYVGQASAQVRQYAQQQNVAFAVGAGGYEGSLQE